MTPSDILNYYAQKELEAKKIGDIIGIKEMFNRYKPNAKVIEIKIYKKTTYVIRKVCSWYCAYIINNNKNKYNVGDFVAEQEITFLQTIEDCDFIKEKSLGKYVIGWDYGHYYNAGVTIEQVREDIEKVIETITKEKSK